MLREMTVRSKSNILSFFRESYGVENSDGTWSGIIGDLVNGEIDIAVAALTQVKSKYKPLYNYLHETTLWHFYKVK